MAASLTQLPSPHRLPCRPVVGFAGSPLVSTVRFSVLTCQERCQARIAFSSNERFRSARKGRSLAARSSTSSPSGSSSEDSKPTEEKAPFGYTRKDVLLIGLGVTLFGVGLKTGLEFVGVDPLQAGNVVQLVIVVGMTVGWILTYMFRVANKDMTYAQQLRDYEEKVMEKRLESLSEAELQALLEQVEEEKQRLAPSSDQTP